MTPPIAKKTVRFSCLLCRQKRASTTISSIMRDANVAVIKCRTCGLIQMETIPSSAELAAFYDQGKQAGNIGVSVDIENLWARQKDDTMRRVALATKFTPKGACVLDIGSGYGFFLRDMKKKGYKLEGIEVSDLSRDISTKVAKSPVHDIDIAIASDETLSQFGTFKLITMFHCLEHIPDPVSFLRRVRTLLASGGKLLIEVPNVDDALLELSDPYRAFYWQFAHCSYFNAQTLSRTLKKAGFKSFSTTHAQRYGIENMMGWIIAGKPQLGSPSYATDKPDLKKTEEFYKADRIKTGRADTLLAIAQK